MLSLFRHATRRSVFAARPASVAHYSEKHAPVEQSPDADANAETSGMEEVHQILQEQDESEPEGRFGDSDSTTPERPSDAKWKGFRYGRFVKPDDLTYKARLNAPRAYQTRRTQQGPPASVARYKDVFHQNGIDPLDLAMDANVLSHFVSEMGKIYGRNVTGLTSKSQRRIGKAIRRAKMMGIIPVLSKSPHYFNSIIRKE
ncbi:30S ribosomal protein S18 [Termitomyces sp. J132]|nr:hypothetical protein C0989_006774 [Termitomyces sp. Mn162]KAH0587744.1 hypothetical protein H2248_006503 [Termitomyces sp. 'cryptogamus']KNZ74802.1 30S ribosomal protein S18 [Termitomyces sp. J132]